MSFFALAGEVVSVSISQGSRPGATASCFSTTWGFPEQCTESIPLKTGLWLSAAGTGDISVCCCPAGDPQRPPYVGAPAQGALFAPALAVPPLICPLEQLLGTVNNTSCHW